MLTILGMTPWYLPTAVTPDTVENCEKKLTFLCIELEIFLRSQIFNIKKTELEGYGTYKGLKTNVGIKVYFQISARILKFDLKMLSIFRSAISILQP